MKFGQYELLELIAVGGMAEVFKGRVVAAEGFEKLVAIKRILPDLAEDERFVKMLLTEARIHSALSHRNIVQIHDLGISEDGQYFIVLEYVEGYDLRIITEQFASEGEIIPEALSLHIASELAQGLHFAHELRGSDGQPLGLIHRDVTPSNVLISLAGEVKLSDFGLAKRRHDRSVVGSLKGNLSYMSPEQAMQASLDRRTDIFSLGAVLFELLTGRRLREITDEVAGWSRAASGELPSVRALRPDLPAPIEALLNRALAADPNQRFSDAGSFGAAIRQVLAQMNVAVGASDLAALLGLVSPPRRPRSLTTERSKVIRLGPEANALREAIAAPATPAPVVITPRPGSEPVRGGGAPPSPAARPGGRAPLEPARSAARPSAAPRAGGPGRASGEYSALAARGPTGGRLSGEYPVQARAPSNGRVSGEYPLQAARGPQAQALRRTPAHGYPPPPRQSPPSPPARPTPAAFIPVVQQPPLAPPRVPRPTARVQPLQPRRGWGTILLVLLALVAGGGAAIHHWVVPLDVLLVWRNPARLSIATDPDGASLRLDGVALVDSSPATITVQRDLSEHLVEATRRGYLPARALVRFDKSVGLSFLLPLERDPSFVSPRPRKAPPTAR